VPIIEAHASGTPSDLLPAQKPKDRSIIVSAFSLTLSSILIRCGLSSLLNVCPNLSLLYKFVSGVRPTELE